MGLVRRVIQELFAPASNVVLIFAAQREHDFIFGELRAFLAQIPDLSAVCAFVDSVCSVSELSPRELEVFFPVAEFDGCGKNSLWRQQENQHGHHTNARDDDTPTHLSFI